MSKRKRKRKRKINSKGFSLVEILAVITIIGILSGIGVAAYGRYKEKAINENMDALVRSTISAFDEYLMDHPNETTVFSSRLISDEYLSNDVDPYNKNGTCTIRIERINLDKNVATSDGSLASNDYRLYTCCANRTRNSTYTYINDKNITSSDNLQVSKNGQCQAGYDVDKLYSPTNNNSNVNNYIETGYNSEPNVGTSKNIPSGVKYKDIAIYSMTEKGSHCNNTTGVWNTYCLTSKCEAKTGQKTEKLYNPYKEYDYHTYGCRCYYSKDSSDKGYVGYERRLKADDSHTMRVFYLNNSNGQNACTSSDQTMFNKYIDHVCSWGVFLNGATKINFHGYQWYRNNSGDYGAFTPDGFWYHDGEPYEWKAKKEPGDTPKEGCAKTCLYMTPYWGGKSS